MKNNKRNNELFDSSHLVILVSFTIFATILIGESLLMGWEKWVLILIGFSIIACWFLHISHIMSNNQRMWINTILTMCCFFFYGIHETSTFDLAVVMSALILLYTMTAEKKFIYFCQVTYYLTMIYEIVNMVINQAEFNSLEISRTAMHFVMIFMIGLFARIIIDKWGQVLNKSNDEIAELTDATERLNDFLANVSHELRTPVNAVIGLSNICIEKEEREDVKKEMIAVRDAGRRVAEQIGDILDYSEIDRNKLASNDEDYILSSILFDIVSEIRPYKPDGIELIIDVNPAIPSVMNTDVTKLKKIIKLLITNSLKYTKEGGVYVRIDCIKEDYGVNLCIEVTDTGIGMTLDETERAFDKFYQVDSGRSRASGGLGLGLGIVAGFVSALNGFLTIESKMDSGTTVRVSVPQKVINPASCMSVINKEQKCIGAFLHFDKYTNPLVREYYNNMVLNIVNGLGVQMHRVDNGEDLRKMLDSVDLTHLFVAEEEYGSAKELLESIADRIMVIVVCDNKFKVMPGSRVRIMEKPFYCFPVATFLNMDVNSEEKDRGRMMCNGVRALVVDDEPMNLSVAKSIFGRYGMIVSTATSGYESVEMCEANEYDIIFMDHMMSGMDGVEAMKRIRAGFAKNANDIPIVALTANAMSSAKKMFLSEGFSGFVSKPIEREELERVLRSVLPKRFISYISEEELRHFSSENVKPNDDVLILNNSQTEGNYFKKESDSKESVKMFDDLRTVGVLPEQGLEYCLKDADFYKDLLLQYASEFTEKSEGLKNMLDEKDAKNYEIMVHALKSTSKMIGAKSLFKKAYDLEMAAKESNFDFINSNHEDAISEYKKITDKIIELYAVQTFSENESEILEFEPNSKDDEEVFEFEPVNEEN